MNISAFGTNKNCYLVLAGGPPRVVGPGALHHLHHLYGRHWVKIFSNEQEMRTKRAQNAANGSLDSPKVVWQPGCARTRWRSLQRSPDPLAGFRGEGRDEREGKVGMGKGEIGPPTFWLLPPPMTSGQGNLTQGRIAAAHRDRQMTKIIDDPLHTLRRMEGDRIFP